MKRLLLLTACLLIAAMTLPAFAYGAEPFYMDAPIGDVAPGPMWDVAVPADTDLVVPAGWVAGNRGLTLSAPTFTQFFYCVKDAQGNVVVSIEPAESRAYWLPIMPADPEELPTFRPLGTKPWNLPWEAGIGTLSAGTYTVHCGAIQTRKANDLLYYGTNRPVIMLPGRIDWYYQFTVE